jgi:transitional endoplasmic reticulum ATPase
MDQLVKVDQSVIILGATNHPEAIDTSILRPGRLDRLVFVGTPNTAERLQILRVLAKRTNISENVDLEAIARKTDGYTGADLQAVVRKAGLLTLKNKALIQIQQDAIEYALNYVSASVP